MGRRLGWRWSEVSSSLWFSAPPTVILMGWSQISALYPNTLNTIVLYTTDRMPKCLLFYQFKTYPLLNIIYNVSQKTSLLLGWNKIIPSLISPHHSHQKPPPWNLTINKSYYGPTIQEWESTRVMPMTNTQHSKSPNTNKTPTTLEPQFGKPF